MARQKARARRTRSTPKPAISRSTSAPRLVVGIGASAGGLDAVERLISSVPARSGFAFVVVQHLEPRHPSMLAELVARSARTPVVQAKDGMRAERDHVFVIAPSTVLTLEGGVLRVAPAVDGATRTSIDTFLGSLAEDQGDGAVGIVLSGTGSDGTAGLRMIQEHGGLTFAQSPPTAQHGDMPRSAIEAGYVDHVLRAEEMPARLLEHARHRASVRRDGERSAEAMPPAQLARVCSILHRRTGHDFGGYKQGTLLRRIHRRIHVQRAASVAEYLRVLSKDPREPERLLKDLLVGVTAFFRDPEAFEALAARIVPRIVEGRGAETPIRVWVPGCASGEEAYSLAILLRERLEKLESRRLVQIFATDIDAEMLGRARLGRYGPEIEGHVSPERLGRFFVRDRSGFAVAKELREMCLFSQHSVIRDPPFSSLDLISCRNVLIYLESDLQKKLIPIFHYALRPTGHLFLGPSESLAVHADLFEAVDRRHRIFRRKETVVRPAVEFPLSGRSPTPPPAPAIVAPDAAAGSLRQKVSAAFERMALDEYTAPCAVVNGRGEIVLVAGRLGRFFQPPSGALSTNLLDVVPASLRVELRLALHAVEATGRKVVRDDVPVELDDGMHRVRLTVRPVPGVESEPDLVAVVLQEHAPLDEVADEAAAVAPDVPALDHLETELRTTRAELKTAVEALESANEELRSSNEELISTNEELQSANEELQTSKEELQSLNEELETVNAELRRKVEELAVANADLHNLFAATEIATIFLDRELRVARFTPAATALFRLLDRDVGRPIADFAPRFEGQDLVADAREVLRTSRPVERQVRGGEPARWFILRVLPYKTADDVVAGAVVTFVDVSDLKRTEEDLRAARERAEWLASFPARNPIPIAEVDVEGRVRYANAAAERIFPGVVAAGRAHPWLAGWEDVSRVFREHGAASHERIVQVGGAFFQQNMYFVPETNCVRVYSVDVTERRRAEEALRESEHRYSVIHDKAPFAIALTRMAAGTLESVNDTFARMFEFTREELIGKTSVELGIADAETQARVAEEFRRKGAVRDFEVKRRTKSGVELVLSLNLDRVGIRGEDYVLTSIQDITARTRAEEALRAAEERFRALTMASSDVVYRMSPDWSEMWHLRGREFIPNTDSPTRGWVQKYIHPDDQPHVMAVIEQAIRTRSTFELEHRVLRVDGSLGWTFSRAIPLFDAKGAIVEWFGAASDITNRKQAEEAVLRSREGLGRLAEASQRVVSETDFEGMLQAVAEAALALTGARLATCGHGHVGGRFMVGGSARAAAAPACPPGDMFAVERGGVHMELAEAVDVIRLTDAELRAHPRWWGLPLNHVPMRGLLGVRMVSRSGRPSGMILVTDKEAGDFTEEDESLVVQLATIASLALQHVEARISLEESDRSKNHFLAMLSHELRNPLAPIRNSLFILERVPPGGEQARRAHDVIDRQVVHLTRIVDDLLDITRISRDKIHLQRERLDLCDVVRRAAEDHRASFTQGGIELAVAVPAGPLWMTGDRTRIAQVIGNLVQNSAKFTEPGGHATVSVEANARLREAVVRVRDTGVGISPEMLPRVFEPFAQADTTLARSKGGLGLGLALVKGLVEMHGGTVSVESEGMSKGAEFAVRFPLEAGELPEAEPKRRAPDARPHRVLVIEDNFDAADSLREVLEFGGHTVEVAYSGSDGIAKAKAFRPEVVLCDIGLPGLDGYAVARTLRSEPSIASAKLVALTGYAAPEDVARSREAGFDAHLAKPLSVEKLVDVLAAWPDAPTSA